MKNFALDNGVSELAKQALPILMKVKEQEKSIVRINVLTSKIPLTIKRSKEKVLIKRINSKGSKDFYKMFLPRDKDIANKELKRLKRKLKLV